VSGGEGAVARVDAEAPWTVLRLVQWSGGYLREKGVGEGRLDAEHLLAHVLGATRLELYLQHDRPLTTDELGAFRPLLRRRAAREPLQYILGRTQFRELELITDRRVLIPRPETEELVDLVLARSAGRSGLTALDLGTGSGCIALSLLGEGPFTRVVGTDLSAAALEVAGLNAKSHGLVERLDLRRGPLYEPVTGQRFDVVVSNPPYVDPSDGPHLQPEVRDWEPGSALFAEERGLAVLRALVTGAPEHLGPGGLLALETGLGQGENVVRAIRATRAFDDPELVPDLSGRPRFVAARLAGS
jgi:release factor glutamine methyltransferase